MAEPPRLFLITPLVADAAAFAPVLQSALEAVEIACVLLRTPPADEAAAKAVVRALAPMAQAAGAAALVAGDARRAARLDVDGVHIEDTETLHEAVRALKPDRIVGVGSLTSRDAAMAAGEAGVDYLMFGGPDSGENPAAVCERVAWWAEIFNVPCVGYAAAPEQVGAIVAAGAEFVGLCDGLWDGPETVDTVLKRIVAHGLAGAESVA